MEREEKGIIFFYRYFMQPVTLFSGIFFNVCLYIIIYRQQKTKFLESTKPLRYFLMVILLSDTWYLIDKVNLWAFSFSNLSTINFMCQFISYLNYFFPILLEFSMLTADYILISLVMKSRKFSKSPNIYNDFLNKQSDLKKFSSDKKQYSMAKSDSRVKGDAKVGTVNSSKYGTKNEYEPDFKKSKKTNTIEETRYSLIATNFEDSKSIDSEQSGHEPKPFIKLIENYRFKRENAYYSIFLKEKFFLILNIFVWMYLLSFIFWIKGLTDLNSGNILKIANATSTEPLGRICSTLVYYQRLAAILNMFLSFLKILTIFMNIFSSIIFHIRFRNEYILSLKSTFRKNYEITKFKMLKFKHVYFFYSTKRTWPDYNDLNSPKIQTKNYISHYKHFHFVRHYALSSLVYSLLVSFSVFTQYKDNLNQLKHLYLYNTEFSVKMAFSSNFSTMSYNQNEEMNDVFFLKFTNESQPSFLIDEFIKLNQNDSFFILSEYLEYLAHSIKFLLYILFSVHFKFHIKFYKNQIK